MHFYAPQCACEQANQLPSVLFCLTLQLSFLNATSTCALWVLCLKLWCMCSYCCNAAVTVLASTTAAGGFELSAPNKWRLGLGGCMRIWVQWEPTWSLVTSLASLMCTAGHDIAGCASAGVASICVALFYFLQRLSLLIVVEDSCG